MKPRPAIIYWRDAWTTTNHRDFKEKTLEVGRDKCMRRDIGFVMERTKDHIIFVIGIIQFDEGVNIYKEVHHIPMATVEKVKYLKE